MRRYLLLVLVGAVASLNASALLAQEDGIRERYDAFNAAFGAADAEAVVAFYADNAIRVHSDGAVMDGPIRLTPFPSPSPSPSRYLSRHCRH